MSELPSGDGHPERGDHASTHDAPTTPLQRLQLSRERMRLYLLPAVRKPRDAEAGIVDKISGKLEDLREHPLIGALIDAVQGWWANHPLRSVADIGNTAARELAEPLVRRHPIASIATALVIGALAVRIRPWRWILRPALFAGLTTQVVSRLLSDAPMEFVLNALTKMKRSSTAAEPSDPSEPVSPVSPASTVSPVPPSGDAVRTAASGGPAAANDPVDAPIGAPPTAVPLPDTQSKGAPAPVPEVATR